MKTPGQQQVVRELPVGCNRRPVGLLAVERQISHLLMFAFASGASMPTTTQLPRLRAPSQPINKQTHTLENLKLSSEPLFPFVQHLRANHPK